LILLQDICILELSRQNAVKPTGPGTIDGFFDQDVRNLDAQTNPGGKASVACWDMAITEIARNKTPRSAGTVGELWFDT
jgi:hypothetical protein